MEKTIARDFDDVGVKRLMVGIIECAIRDFKDRNKKRQRCDGRPKQDNVMMGFFKPGGDMDCLLKVCDFQIDGDRIRRALGIA
jgi:hypothetical protein